MGALLAAGIVGVAGLGAGVASAVTAEGEEFIDPEQATRKNLTARLVYGPGALQMNRIYNQAYGGLSNQYTSDFLFGRPERKIRSVGVPVWKDGRIVMVGKEKGTVTIPEQEGLLGLYQRAGTGMADFNREQLLKDIAGTPLLASLTQRAQEGLDRGGALDPFTRRSLEQASLSDASLRGFGHSPLDAYNVYSSLGAEAEARKRQNEQFALQVYGGMPRQSLAGLYGPALGLQGAAWGRTAATPIMDPFASMGVMTRQPDNTTSNILGATSGGLLNLAGGLAGARGGANRAPTGQWQGYQPQSYVQPRYS